MSDARDQAALADAREEALAGFREQGAAHRNCAQSVLFFAQRVSGGDVECVTAARYLGGGVARMGTLCGVLSGAALAFGFRDLAAPDDADPVATSARMQAIMTGFEESFGATDCRALTGYDLTTREGYRAFAASDARARCAEYVAWACDRVGETLAGSAEVER